jgi:predicted acyltransferase
MILVTDPGTYDAVYPQLRHAAWMGATSTDMIFPSFLFMVGMSIAFSLSSRSGLGMAKSKLASHIFYRSIVLFLLGLAVNGFPDYN